MGTYHFEVLVNGLGAALQPLDEEGLSLGFGEGARRCLR